MKYGLSINTRDYEFEDAWLNADIVFKNHSVGGGSVQYTFPDEETKEKARKIAADTIIVDFDIPLD